MSAAALRKLTSAAAAPLYDAIGRAESSADLDDLARSLWRSHLARAISEADASELIDYIESRRRRPHRDVSRQETLPGFALPDRNRDRVSRFPKRRVQRSPDKQASYERRHRLAYSGVMPPHLAAHLSIGALAVLCIVADEYRRSARCELSLAEIAARAGVCRKTAQLAMKEARDLHLIRITERPIPGHRHLPNLVTIISLDWLKWLRRPASDRVGDGGNLLAPTSKTLKDDSGNHRVQTAAPATAARPERGQPTKEAIRVCCGAGEHRRLSASGDAESVARGRSATGRASLVERTERKQSANRGAAHRRDYGDAPKAAVA